MNKLNIFRIRVLRTICFLLLVIFIDQISGKILKYLYFHQKAGQGANLNYIFSQCNADVLIFGNSRAQHHYDTKIISDSLQMSCYNAGIDGGHSILMTYAQIQVILSRYTPKVIIIEFDPSFVMEYRKDEYDRFDILLPYYKIYPQLNPFIEKRSKMERAKLLSGIYPFNSDLIWLLRFNTKIDVDRNWIFNGYIPIKDKQMTKSMATVPIETATQHKADPEKLRALTDIVHLCKERSIKLYLMNSPKFQSAQKEHNQIAGSTKQVIEVIERERVNYIDFSNSSLFFNQTKLFADVLHLNENGALLYSKIIVQTIKKDKKTRN